MATATVPVVADSTSTVHSRSRAAVVIGVLGLALVAAVLVAAGTGQLHVAPGEVLGSVSHRIGLDWGAMPAHPNGDAVLWDVRFPLSLIPI